jgi:hypothetical protein
MKKKGARSIPDFSRKPAQGKKGAARPDPNATPQAAPHVAPRQPSKTQAPAKSGHRGQ